MAALTQDCFRVAGAPLLTLETALALLDQRVAAVAGSEEVTLREAAGRILAADLAAPGALPPHDNAAVDGYAVRAAELAAGAATRLPVAARLPAGATPPDALPPRCAVRIFTGAALPPGFDSVAMQEDAPERDGFVLIPAGLPPGANRRRAGEDVAAGAVALPAGARLRPQDLGLAAALGVSLLTVRRPLRVALFSTGAELREPGTALEAGAIHDANRYTLLALLQRLGCAVTDLGILPDRIDPIAAALQRAAGAHDLIVTSGGVSMGEEDHVRPAIARGGRLHLWRLAVKPGKPVALGQVGGVPLLALPGNPAAMMVMFLVLGRPLVLRLAGGRAEPPSRIPVTAAFAHAKKPGRREYLRVRLTAGGQAEKVARQGAGMLSSMVEADGLVELAEDLTELRPGDAVSYLPLAGLL